MLDTPAQSIPNSRAKNKVLTHFVALPTGCATCTTSRHRHFSLSRLIETAEIEPGKAETGEKKAGCEEHAYASRRKGCPRSRLLLIPLYPSPAGRQQLSRTLLECRASA